MTLVGKGTILSKIVGKGIVSVKVLGSYTLNTLSPQQAPVVQYNLIMAVILTLSMELSMDLI